MAHSRDFTRKSFNERMTDKCVSKLREPTKDDRTLRDCNSKKLLPRPPSLAESSRRRKQITNLKDTKKEHKTGACRGVQTLPNPQHCRQEAKGKYLDLSNLPPFNLLHHLPFPKSNQKPEGKGARVAQSLEANSYKERLGMDPGLR